MSDSNVGSRKKRNAKDHPLIIHGVINSVVNGNEDCVDIQIYDLEKAFDSLWLEDCLNHINDNTSEDKHNDKLSLLSWFIVRTLTGSAKNSKEYIMVW